MASDVSDCVAPQLPEDLQYLRRIWEGCPDSRVATYARCVPTPTMADWLFRRSIAVLAQPGTTAFGIRSKEVLTACASWRPLAWDSEQFGLPAGRIDMLMAAGEYGENFSAKLKLLSAVVEDCRKRLLWHLTARVDAGDIPAVHALESLGFEWIDAIQTFALDLGSELPPPHAPDFELRAFKPTDLEGILTIARTSYVFDRFHADPALSPETADAINETWLRNACAGIGADHVVVAADSTGVIGYVTCRLDEGPVLTTERMFGTIVMVATAAHARGRGVAVAATLAAIRWFAAQGVKVVEVGTQLRNIPAARVYQKCKFRQVAATLLLRKVLR